MRQATTLTLCAICLLTIAQTTLAQTTQFTYQGKLSDGGAPANGPYALQFKLFDTATVGTGTQQGATVTPPTVTVTGGIFTVTLDFGACASCFNGSPRFLEIAVQSPGVGFITLSPRQPITSNPYAIKSLNAATADGLSVSCVNCVTSTQISSVAGSQVSGLISVSSVPDLSLSYVQNKTSPPQTGANFNIDGNGNVGGTLTGNVVNSATQYNIGGNRLFSIGGTNNFFAGINAGFSNTTGGDNFFAGQQAGQANTSGSLNSFIGTAAGIGNTTGGSNAFFGNSTGFTNTTGSNNTIIGTFANVGAPNLNFATALGAGAVASTSNTVVLGRSADTVQVPGNLGVTGSLTASPGTAAAPSYGFSGAPGWGMFRSDIDKLDLSTAGSSRMSIDSFGIVRPAKTISGSVARMSFAPDGSQAPSVDNLTVLGFGYSAATEITNLVGGVAGQCVVLLTVGANVTISNGGFFLLSAAWIPDSNDTLTVCFTGALLAIPVWIETARSHNRN